MKRLIDIVICIPALLVLLPLLIPIMVILRLTGEGEIFYLQKRVGKNGEIFGLIKFATMLKNSPSLGKGLLTEKNDPRILPMGRFLRKTKLNEIPQLFNIIKGEMTIVGPRPQAKPHFEIYPESVKAEIKALTPGLTGIGSIVFRDEENLIHNSNMDHEIFYKDVIAPYKGALEVWYKNHNNMRTDFLLMFLTAWVVIFPKSYLVYQIFPDLPEIPISLKKAIQY